MGPLLRDNHFSLSDIYLPPDIFLWLHIYFRVWVEGTSFLCYLWFHMVTLALEEHSSLSLMLHLVLWRGGAWRCWACRSHYLHLPEMRREPPFCLGAPSCESYRDRMWSCWGSLLLPNVASDPVGKAVSGGALYWEAIVSISLCLSLSLNPLWMH